MSERVPDRFTESRLEELRREASLHGKVDARGVRPPGAPFPRANAESGYYGVPLLKEPTWTWEVPLYFFVGGAAGAAALIAAAAQMSSADRELVRDARWIAAAGAAASAPLLIADLGQPSRFLNMLRVFKLQSPMSVGAWTLTAFGGASSAAAFAEMITKKTRGAVPVKIVGDVAGVVSGIAGLGMATYTGVLVGATTIPVWAQSVELLPPHFAASGLSSAVSILELMGHDESALNVLGILATLGETAVGAYIEAKRTRELAPLRNGRSGAVTRLGGVLSGPIPLALRIVGAKSRKLQQVAALCSIAGSLITRYAWVEAGRVSARDAKLQMGLEGGAGGGAPLPPGDGSGVRVSP